MTHAADPWPLPADDALEPVDDTLTVSQVGQRLEAAVSSAFPGTLWVLGEASGLTRTVAKAGRAGHWYFQLTDPEVTDARRRPTIELKCWRGTVQRLFGPRGKLTGVLEPEDGIVLRVRVKVDYYAPRGQVSFTVEDIDPDYTLGALDRERRELLVMLEQDGSLARNGRLRLPDVPLDLGLITSEGSAAHHDVLQTLADSGLGFRVRFCDARTQGAATGPSVVAALATLAAMPLDAILLVRGGGSRLDLSWFDKQDVARAIAACPLPVLTGIGHEIDHSVADEVAHSAHRTPTGVAEDMVARARAAHDELEAAAVWLAAHATSRVQAADDGLVDAARALQSGAGERLSAARESLVAVGHRLSTRSAEVLTSGGERLAAAWARLASPVHAERLTRRQADLLRDGRRLTERAQLTLERHEQALASAAERARLLDPAAVLARGYAWLRREDGKLLMDAGKVTPGERLTVVLRDGELPVRHDPSDPRTGS
ncbi:MAG: exodeoxyribonuclease VII large subunit [Planctomycetota bacterium]|nr:MAG: exodeoxyribonuclease VII large subunit [Planctomycetota bacterium]